VIDINADMGESFGAWTMGADAALLEQVTSANIACGFHAGDPRVMDATVARAAERGVTIGAQLRVSPDELITDVLYQIGALEAFCRRHQTAVRYVKAHGALYNDLAGDERLAAALGQAVAAYDAGLSVLALAGSPAVDVLRQQGLPVVAEGFADRGYTAAGRLVPRSQPGAVLTDPAAVAERGWRIATGAPIEIEDGSPLVLDVGSLCVHGDTPGAVGLARELRAVLSARTVEVAAFA
jgi:UPF0271 protein